MKAYSNYKELKGEVLQQIPSDWSYLQVRRLTKSHKQGYYTEAPYIQGGVKLIRITDIDDNGNVSYAECPFVPISPEEEQAFRVFAGDFLFARSGTIGRFGIVRREERAVFASYLIRFQFSNKANLEFLKYYFLSFHFAKQLISELHGGANKNIHAENIKDCKTCIPSLPEQRSIARFLDDKTAKIDTLIEKKRRLIELLKEERQAVINHAITKGLNPNAKMKPSEIEWLGDVPEGWEVSSFTKYLESIIDYRGRTPEKLKVVLFS